MIQPHPPRISLAPPSDTSAPPQIGLSAVGKRFSRYRNCYKLLILLNTTPKSSRNSCINVTALIYFYKIFNFPPHLFNLNNLINLIFNCFYLILKHRCRFVAAVSLLKWVFQTKVVRMTARFLARMRVFSI